MGPRLLCHRLLSTQSSTMHPGGLPTELFRSILQDAGFTIEDFRRR